MYLIFDTETTDLINAKLPPTDPKQAHICQLGCLLLDKDFNDLDSFKSLIKPSGWTISQKAFERHHIRQEDCEENGIPIKDALDRFYSMLFKAQIRVGHNVLFDIQMIEIEEVCVSGYDYQRIHVIPSFCTMLSTTNICKLPGKYGKYKWPKLIEAYRHFFNCDFDNAHDAFADVRACAAIYKQLVSSSQHSEPILSQL